MSIEVEDASLWKKVTTRQLEERDLKRKAVIRTAGQLFAERGAHRTSMTDIAERLNITKPALYHYFKSKNEILFECYKMGAELTENALNQVEHQCPNGLEKVRAYIQVYIEVLTEEMGANVILFDDRDLDEEQRQEIKEMRRKIQNRLKNYIQEGINDGSVKNCDITLIANTIAGAITGISYWYKPEGKLSSQEIAENISEYLLIPLTNSSSFNLS